MARSAVVRRPAYCTAKADDEPCLASDVVVRLASGSLAPLERRAIERRLDECELCRRFVAEVLRQSAEAGAAAPADHPGDSAARPTASLRGPGAPLAAPAAPAAPAAEAPGARPGRGALGLPLPGQRVDRYLIERPLGAGGMGMVSLALDEELKRHIVIKLVRPDLLQAQADGSEGTGPASTLDARLVREAQALARLSHPNVVSIFDIGRYGQQVFFAMEYVAGVDLASYLGSAPRAHADILARFCAAGAGLAAAHRAGVIHRDFKPANVLIGEDGAVKVADFGLARGVAAPTGEPASRRGHDARQRSSMLDAALTRIDRTVGTPAYMAPEQIAGEGVDARSDQFAFAVALSDALLRQSPATRRITPQTAGPAELAELEALLTQAGVTAAQAAALVRALAPEPTARWPQMEALIAALLEAPAAPGAGARGDRAEAAPASGPLPASDGTVPGAPRRPPGSSTGTPAAPAPPAPDARPAPARPPRRGRRLLIAAALAVTSGALAWAITRSATSSGAGCAERDQLTGAMTPARRAALLTAATGPDPFDRAFSRWTGEAAVQTLAQQVSLVAAAHGRGCASSGERLPPDGCTPTPAAEVLKGLGDIKSLPEVLQFAGTLQTCAGAGVGAASPSSPSSPSEAVPGASLARLERARQQLATGDLELARTQAAELGAELSARAPLLGATAWAIAASAALWAGHRDASSLAARAAADAERAGDDGRRAHALVLELEAATLRHDAARVEQLGELLRSLVARRGNRPAERAQIESVLAEAQDELGSHLATAAAWDQVRALAVEAGATPLIERAEVGKQVATLRAQRYRRLAREEPAPGAAGPIPQELQRALAPAAWTSGRGADAPSAAQLAALAAALDLGLALDPQVVRAADALRSRTDLPDGALPPSLRAALRLAGAALAGTASAAWLQAELAHAQDQHRRLEATALALAYAARALATHAPDAADSQRLAARQLYGGGWLDDNGRPPAALALASALAEAALVTAGQRERESVILTRSAYQGLPQDSLLRAEAAWQYAVHGKLTSKYLQGEEDLEPAIPLWRALGAPGRAATAAWWIVQESPYPRDRARRLAELARTLYDEAGDASHTEELEAWLAAHPAQ